MRILFIAVILPFFWTGVSHAQEIAADLVHDINFFQNSNRRDLTPDEEKLIVRVTTGKGHCTAFFVENTSGKLLLGSARHCFGYTVGDACKKDIIRVVPTGAMKDRFLGSCRGLAVSSVKNDLTIFEMNVLDPQGKPADVELEKKVRDFYVPLRLAGYWSPTWFNLRMYGYPGDKNRQGRPTASENCWIEPDNTPMAIQAIPSDQIDESFWEAQRNPLRESSTYTSYDERLDLQLRKFNCSVYGGNSGGPIVIQNTLDVIGLPRSYYRGLYATIPETAGHEYEEVRNFIERNRADIDKYGIAVSREPRRIGGDFDYLKELRTDTLYVPEEGGCALSFEVDTKAGVVTTTYREKGSECDRPGVKVRWFCETSARKFCVTSRQDAYWFINKIGKGRVKMTNQQGIESWYDTGKGRTGQDI